MKPRIRLRVRHDLDRISHFPEGYEAYQWFCLWADGEETCEVTLGGVYTDLQKSLENLDLWNQGTAV